MTTNKTVKKKITTASTHLQKPQIVVLRDPRAISKPDETVNPRLSWRKNRRTRVTVAEGFSISGLS
jgi:hypothetical protein